MKPLSKALVLFCAAGLAACANGVGLADAPDSERDAAAVEPPRSRDDASSANAFHPDVPDASVAYDAARGDDAALRDAEPRDSANGPDATVTADASTTHDASSGDSAVLVDSGVLDSSSPTCAGSGVSGVLATFELVGQPGNEDVASATSVAAGLRMGALSRSPALNATGAAGSISSSNWSMGTSADAHAYYALILTPTVGCSLDVASLALDTRASNTGPTSIDIATNADSFTRHFGAFAGTATTTVAVPSVGGSNPLEIRIYGYGASSTAGTLRIQNVLTVTGAIH